MGSGRTGTSGNPSQFDLVGANAEAVARDQRQGVAANPWRRLIRASLRELADASREPAGLAAQAASAVALEVSSAPGSGSRAAVGAAVIALTGSPLRLGSAGCRPLLLSLHAQRANIGRGWPAGTAAAYIACLGVVDAGRVRPISLSRLCKTVSRDGRPDRA